MNMFRNLLTLALIIFAIALVFGSPEKWSWIDSLGGTAVTVLRVCIQFRAFVVVGCVVVSLALWMTRKQY